MALARANGWDGTALWSPATCNVLGDGPENLGTLSCAGPFLLSHGRPLFRAPRHLLGAAVTDGWQPVGFLRPGNPVACDLGNEVRLPEYPNLPHGGPLNAGDDQWITADGMNAVRCGQPPGQSEMVGSTRLWSAESRIGLQRDKSLRTAMEGMLYSSRHIRLERSVSLGMHVSGVPADWTAEPLERLVPLGGEGRVAELSSWSGGLNLKPLDTTARSQRVSLIALTPLDLEPEICRGKKPIPGIEGVHVVSACLERPQRVGGWDSLAHRPLSAALRSSPWKRSVLRDSRREEVRKLVFPPMAP